jgi:Flp pilus assembly protein TadD
VALQDARWSEAAMHLRRAIALGVNEKLLHGRLGVALLFSGDAAGALRELDAEAHESPPWPEIPLRRGQALQALGRRDEARRAYEQASALAPTAAEARDSLAALRGR